MENNYQNICCPKCQSDLEKLEYSNFLECSNCKTQYQIKNDIPILLTQKI